MALFILTCTDRPGALPRRVAQRPVHLAYLNQHAAMVKVGGPLLNTEGEPTGSLLIVEAESLAEVEAFAAGDPYNAVDLFEQVEITPWRVSVGSVG
jgi:uncharacterized protein YciI